MKKSILLNFSFLFLLFQISINTAQENFKTPYGNNKKAGEFVKINGTKIYYETYGKGEPLLIIHSCEY
ncbi:hypothetical protein PG910_10170 [Tenacibaculum dicentrarchi]|nr:hypothetical protein PG910_10170 [Tenacibaculum dicentrarchi]